jgi:very-short-patch-repair endonuclease
LNEHGVRVIRFTNSEVMQSLEAVLDSIRHECALAE